MPHLDVRPWDYGGDLIGYGTYHYRTGAGAEGDWVALGVGDRKKYVSLYSTAVRDGRYLTEEYADRFPGCPVRQELNITRPDLLNHEAIANLAKETAAHFAGQYLSDENPRRSGRRRSAGTRARRHRPPWQWALIPRAPLASG